MQDTDYTESIVGSNLEALDFAAFAEPILTAYSRDRTAFLKASSMLNAFSQRLDYPFCRADIDVMLRSTLGVPTDHVLSFIVQLASTSLSFNAGWTEELISELKAAADSAAASAGEAEQFTDELVAFLATYRLMFLNLAIGTTVRPDALIFVAADQNSDDTTIMRLVCQSGQKLDVTLNSESRQMLLDTLRAAERQGEDGQCT